MRGGGHQIEEIEAPTRKADKIENLGAKLSQDNFSVEIGGNRG